LLSHEGTQTLFNYLLSTFVLLSAAAGVGHCHLEFIFCSQVEAN